MKKIILALMVLACAAATASAATGVAVQWTTYWGAYTSDATDLTGTEDYLLDSYSITWQLVYSTDATAGAPDLGNAANGWVSGNDEVWATRTMPMSVGGANVTASDSTEWYNYLYNVSGDQQYLDPSWSAGDVGYIYQRVYQGTPAALSYYYDSAPVGLDADPPTYQSSYLDAAGGGTAGIQPNQQISAIPEPATMGLLGLGALVMAIRRRRS